MPDDVKSEDEIATEQAALGAPGTETAPDVAAADPIKDWFRANIGWVMAEIDYTKQGHSPETRSGLNP